MQLVKDGSIGERLRTRHTIMTMTGNNNNFVYAIETNIGHFLPFASTVLMHCAVSSVEDPVSPVKDVGAHLSVSTVGHLGVLSEHVEHQVCSRNNLLQRVTRPCGQGQTTVHSITNRKAFRRVRGSVVWCPRE